LACLVAPEHRPQYLQGPEQAFWDVAVCLVSIESVDQVRTWYDLEAAEKGDEANTLLRHIVPSTSTVVRSFTTLSKLARGEAPPVAEPFVPVQLLTADQIEQVKAGLLTMKDEFRVSAKDKETNLRGLLAVATNLDDDALYSFLRDMSRRMVNHPCELWFLWLAELGVWEALTRSDLAALMLRANERHASDLIKGAWLAFDARQPYDDLAPLAVRMERARRCIVKASISDVC